MNNEMTNTPPFKVKCTYIDNDCLTVDKEYDVAEVDEGFYEVKNDNGKLQWYYDSRFEIVETPQFKAKCIDNDCANLTIGKEYDAVKADCGFYKVKNDSGWTQWYCGSRFEIVETPKDKQEFSVGDKVYKYGETDVKTVLEVFENGYMQISNYPHRVNHETICYATQENYEMLCKLYPHIEFELPPKEITRSDLTKEMLQRMY